MEKRVERDLDYWKGEAELWEGRFWTLKCALEDIRKVMKKAIFTLEKNWEWGDE